MRLFGGSTPSAADVNVSAVAAMKAVPGIPIAIMQKVCNGSTQVNNVLLVQSNANVDNSCWTTYTDNPPSASKVQALFHKAESCSGLPANTDLITIGTLIELNNGQAASTYSDALDVLITNNPGKCWMVPVVTDSTKCNQQDAILDWAKICPYEVIKNGNDKHIGVNLTCQQSLFRKNDNLCYSTRLVREPTVGM